MSKISFIGLGNMGSAILQSILSKNQKLFEKYFLFDVLSNKLDAFKDNPRIIICDSILSAIENTDYIFLAVKPQSMGNILEELKKSNLDNKKIISIAAGLQVKFYKQILGENSSITRVMPNTPFLVGEGAAGISFDDLIDEKSKKEIKEIFESGGEIIECEEKYLDVVTGLSGSGPAYFFMIIEALADGAVKMGLPRDQAYKLAAQTALGSAKMVLETNKHPGVLKDMVTSPGGTTIEAISILEDCNLRGTLIKAVEAATKKSQSFH